MIVFIVVDVEVHGNRKLDFKLRFLKELSRPFSGFHGGIYRFKGRSFWRL